MHFGLFFSPILLHNDLKYRSSDPSCKRLPPLSTQNGLLKALSLFMALCERLVFLVGTFDCLVLFKQTFLFKQIQVAF